MKTHKKLWKEAFHDSKEYIDYYFANKAVRSGVYSDYEDGRLCAMAYFTPYQTMFMGRECKTHYIVGVATAPSYRHQKRMTKLLEQGVAVCFQEESPLVFLSPETPRVYRSLGFVETYWRETTTVNYEGERWFKTIPFCELNKREREEIAVFAEGMLSAEGFELYLKHSEAYYEDVEKELNVLNGEVLAVYEGKEPVAVVNYICEEEQMEVTELICQKDKGKKVVETICDYLGTGFLKIDDSYFISEIEGKGIVREKQGKPYIMYKITSAEESPVLRCYINDIT